VVTQVPRSSSNTKKGRCSIKQHYDEKRVQQVALLLELVLGLARLFLKADWFEPLSETLQAALALALLRII
jgi:hypothetical protein